MNELAENIEIINYDPIPTIRDFHCSNAQIRCIVGPVGSAKSTAGAWELCYLLPYHIYNFYGEKNTRWAVIRNTYKELMDTTQRTFFEWFGWGVYRKQDNIYILQYPDGVTSEILFRSCDRPDQVKQFKSLELTGYLADESIEIPESIKRMLKNRIGRYPKKIPCRFGIETTNPPDIEHPTYYSFDWGNTPPPGPVSEKKPLENHRGFWQPPRENEINLRPGYYEDLIKDYRDYPDWIEMYVDGKPGIMKTGKLIYNNFIREKHVSKTPLKFSGGDLYIGYDNSGNTPAAIVLNMPNNTTIRILREYNSDKMGIVDFTNWVLKDVKESLQFATLIEYADPAGEAEFSTKRGGFTSNAQLMRDECGSNPIPSNQNITARIIAVDKALKLYDLLIDPSCTRLINGFLGGYHYKEIGTTGIFQDAPNKNRFSHIHEALQYVLVKLIIADHLSHYDSVDLDEVFE